MDSSLRIIPASSSRTASIQSTSNSLGLHDSLQYGPRSLEAEVKSTGGFKDRVENWDATQDNLKLTMERNVFGMHAPMRKLMERKIVASGMSHLPTMRPSNVHLDILMGRDTLIGPADVFLGSDSVAPFDLHKEFEKKSSN
ncbi:proteasome maturation factor UMP1-domain-containing protein [Panaeolus papilionaceus]|nr:proteasome maturation factor UMP1-domain-containing protein [Panaeolus papilionaceus]